MSSSLKESAPSPHSPAAPELKWTDPLLVNPHEVEDKAERVQRMFTAIAPTYDLNNRLHSMGTDQYWRRVAVKMAGVKAGECIVDVACGTGDLTLKFAHAVARAEHQPGGGDKRGQGRVVGIDFTYDMLPLAKKKSVGTGIHYLNGDAMDLPLADRSTDVVSIAFGIRNVSNWGRAIEEFARVLKPGGRLIILEFSLPTNAVIRGLYNFYFRKMIPISATLISGDKTGAYKYLPESVNTFISREAMQDRMKAADFNEVVAKPLTFGVCVCYRGVKGSLT